MVLICMPLITDDVEQIFLCLFAISMSSLVTYAFKYFAQFSLSCLSYCVLFIPDPSPLLDNTFC